ncbi:hypothetical protein [Pelagicoccus mobilis]|uniref:CorA-like Mg2+ transporter protein n=1 Tax=Pelagicoccus mobilis TaxID=415221 RepID=A0A934RW98_9BACT|nr:hypothetical protein [Pelagicoccus mobilis]MBK1877528.1 hypothetical protein [Pelagicoccus mobilis]
MPRKNYDWTLPPEIESRLSAESYGPQRAIHEAGHLLIILHRPPSEDDDLNRERILFLLPPDGKLQCNGKPDGEAKLKRLITDYRTRWEELDRDYSLHLDASGLFELIEAVTPLKRSSANLANTLQSAREASQDNRFLIGMRDASQDIARAFEILLSDLQTALDFRVAKNAEEQSAKTEEMAAAQHRLNLLAAFTFPVMAVATLLGMNLKHGFEKQHPSIFWSVLGAGILIGFFVRSWILKKPKAKKPQKLTKPQD